MIELFFAPRTLDLYSGVWAQDYSSLNNAEFHNLSQNKIRIFDNFLPGRSCLDVLLIQITDHQNLYESLVFLWPFLVLIRA